MVHGLQKGRLDQFTVHNTDMHYVLSTQFLKLVQRYNQNYVHIMEIT